MAGQGNEEERQPQAESCFDYNSNEAFDDGETMLKNMERRSIASDLEGLAKLSTDAVKLTTQTVEAQHSRLDWFGNAIFKDRGKDKVRNPIAGLVYNSIYLINGVVGAGLGLAFSALSPILGDATPSKRKDSAISILNGVVGDFLEAQKNPLAIPMQCRAADGTLLDTQTKLQQLWERSNNGRILLLIHGSCNSPHDWWQEGHNHGIQLSKDLSYTPIFLHYNTGLHISDNGKQLAALLNRLAGSYPPQPEQQAEQDQEQDQDQQQQQQQAENPSPPPPQLSVAIVAHSMGGLVARSACYYAEQQHEQYNSNQWLESLSHMITLGSPHHGAVLEQGGKLADAVLGAHPYTEPISWVGKIRSKGVTDLGFGNVRDEDWLGYSGIHDNRKPTPLPKMVRCLAVAAVLTDGLNPSSSTRSLLGDTVLTDGLVKQGSALGKGNSNPLMDLEFDETVTFFRHSHVGLLSSDEVYSTIHTFLNPVSGGEGCH